MLFLLSLAVLSGFSQTYNVIIQYSFKHIEEGYDHPNKIIVYVYNVKAGESGSKKESETNALRIPISAGMHTVKIENWAYYNDKWELHSKANNYSFDLINSERIDVHHHLNIKLIYDLDNGALLTYK